MWETHPNDYDGGPRISLITHSLVLHFPRWRLSQILHPGDVQNVKFPTHVRFTVSSLRGLHPSPPPPPSLGKPLRGALGSC